MIKPWKLITTKNILWESSIIKTALKLGLKRILISLNKNLKGLKEIEICVNINEALRIVLNKFRKGKILICGSLYLAGQVLKNDGFKIN